MAVTFHSTNERAGHAVLLVLIVAAVPLGLLAPTEVLFCAAAGWALGVVDWLVFGWFLYRWRRRRPHDVPFHLHVHGFYARLLLVSLGCLVWYPYAGVWGVGGWVLAFLATHIAAGIGWGLTPVFDSDSVSPQHRDAQQALAELTAALTPSTSPTSTASTSSTSVMPHAPASLPSASSVSSTPVTRQ